MASGVTVEISARDKNVAAVLKGVSDTLGSSAEGMKTSFRGLGKESDGLFGSLKELRGEARQHERVFSYYGKQLADVAGIAKGLGTEIAGLGIALGSGMWTVAAIEGVRMLISYLKESQEEAEKLNKEKLDDFEKGLRAAEAAAKGVHEELLKVLGEDPRRNAMGLEYLQIQKEIAALKGKIQLLPGESERLDKLNEQAKQLLATIREFDETKRRVKGIRDDQADAESQRKAQEQARKDEIREEQEYYKMLGDYSRAMDKERAAEHAAQYKQDLAEAQRIARDKIAEDNAIAEGEEIIRRRNEAERAKEAADERRIAAQRVAEAQRIGSAIGNALAQGHNVGLAVFKAALSEAVKVGADAAIKLVTQSMIKGEAESGASQGWAGPAGIALGIGAAAELFTALIAQIPGKAEGGPIFSGQTRWVGERGPELFTPGSSGMITPNHALGGGEIHIHAMDAKSFLGFARSRKTELVKVVSELVQEGRM